MSYHLFLMMWFIIKFSYENKIDHTDRHIRIVYFKAKFYV